MPLTTPEKIVLIGYFPILLLVASLLAAYFSPDIKPNIDIKPTAREWPHYGMCYESTNNTKAYYYLGEDSYGNVQTTP